MKNNCDYFQFLSSNFLGKNKCKKLEYEKEFSRDKNDFLNTAKFQNIFLWGEKHKCKNYYFENWLCSEIHILSFPKS